MLYSLHAISGKDDTVVLAYYFGGAAGAADDAWEAALASETRSLWPAAAGGGGVTTVVHGRVVLLHGRGDLVFILSGDGQEDELSVSAALPNLLAVIQAVCEERVTPSQMVSFHGKVIQCLHEAYPQGMRKSTNVDAILRAAKLKAVGGS